MESVKAFRFLVGGNGQTGQVPALGSRGLDRPEFLNCAPLLCLAFPPFHDPLSLHRQCYTNHFNQSSRLL